ncbi:DEK domain-containing chromatin-associated protein 1-like isoform X2 [Gastrolobium bilobum]|uniref:DEK domain-containing chromatin-associated protein 1-like isoform X2 n=1 Tax=Gastrolobium bilobum TaxID=150636 RepID=UPI002AB21F09|nr:DEK domain-containing chromatin-associated protein 1-like isoform X2 [Gastrolobium bilobum]
MATETLEDNKPPFQDKDDDHAPPKPLQNKQANEAAEEPKPEEEGEAERDTVISQKDAPSEVAKSEDKNVDEEETGAGSEVEAEAEEKGEANEHDDAEKDDEEEVEKDEEEEEEKDEEEDEKEEAEEITPVSERPTRERKTVERYSIPSPAKSSRSSASKGLTIEKGRGTQLKDIPNVAFKLSKRKPDENLHMLHSLLFGKKTKAHNLKRNIGQFSGYVWTENEEKQRAKVKERIDKCVKEKLMDFCDILNIPINKTNVKKEELSAKLLEFLESPHATTDVLLADKEQKGKKRTRKATPSKSPGEASMETPAKKQKQTSQSGKKRKQSSDVEEDDKAELSDAKDESQEDEDVAVPKYVSDDEESKSEEEEDKSKAHKHTSKKIVKEGSVAKAGDGTTSVKKTSAKATKSSEKTPKKSSSKKIVTDHDSASASVSKSKQTASKKQKTVREKENTKGKTASKKQTDKSSKALVKDQGKGKSSKKAKPEPSREDMHAVVVDILKEVDFNTATLSDILRQLGTHFGVDLMHRKAEVKDIITDVINNMSDEEGEEAENDGDGDADKDEDDGDGDDDA